MPIKVSECSVCSKKTSEGFKNIYDKRKLNSRKCPDCQRKQWRIWWRMSYHRRRKRPEFLLRRNRNKRKCLQRWRQKVIDKYGGKCMRCSFSDMRALQIDHINGGGKWERERNRNPLKYWRMVLQDTSGKYQLLCANCNWIKRSEQQEYKILLRERRGEDNGRNNESNGSLSA